MTPSEANKLIWIEECGCVRSWWVRLPGEPARMCGHVDCVSQDRAIEIARLLARSAARHAEVAADLAARHPEKQIYNGLLPCSDIEWAGEDREYLYILADRRRRGKYRILEAIAL